MCRHGEPIGEGNQFILRLRADTLVPQATFSGCLENAGGAAVRLWGSRLRLPALGELLCRPLLLTVLALKMWPSKEGLHVAHRPWFPRRSKLQSLGEGDAKKSGSFGSSEAL